MDEDCVQALAFKFGLQGKDFMSGSKKNKVIRVLSKFESNQKVL